MVGPQNPRRSARNCATMDDVRSGIDQIDRELVRLVAERQAFIEAAARIKKDASDVRVEWRIEDVVAKVLAAAQREGLSPRIAEPVWREMIERCIEHELACWQELRDPPKKTSAAR